MSESNNTVGAPAPPPATPAQPLAPGNFDRAWNDPPLFSYSAASGQTTAPTRLNKRVPFPTQQGAVLRPGLDPTQPPKLYDAGMKPPSSSCLPPPPPPAMVAPTPQPSHCHSDGDRLPVTPDTVHQTFLRIIDRYLETDMQEDVKTRLAGLFREWKDGGLNSAIQETLGELAGSLDRGDLLPAETIFTRMTADWSSQIGPSNIMIIKKILYAAKLSLDSVKEDEALTKPL